ncbi:DNA polymerase III subunit alpha [Anaeromyxobacter dehalogenans]|uniref:DNA polymerase III subunit alpha n=1 Tax=Anaeromyxobacter dehalogenans (strain 2CP-C) TaxID=290397 RepID=Q2IF52_ANADE|nr:DNA polymerase III subunit alpha [Anaeromyxobacter dehalogenans]ABC83212.1 DNA polymerase III, alpha subunit [Anaeromyxobacter dehalogenans 2CP-C]
MPDFVHLHLHTLYSLLDGAIRIKDLLKTVKAKGMSSVAVTDHGNLFGAVDFYKKAKEAGVKPILGMEAYVAGDKGRTDRSERIGRHLILLAKNAEGWANLRYLSSKAFTEGFYYDPRIDKQLLRDHSKGLVGLTACLAGEVPRLARQGDMDGARRVAREYRDIFEPGSFFLEVQSNGMREQLDVNAKLAQLGRDEGIPLVGTADAHYVSRQEAKAHEVLMCIASNKTFQDPKRLRHDTDGLFVAGPDEMAAALPDFREALDNTLRIAEMCNVELPLGKTFLPSFTLPEGMSEDDYIVKLAREGLDRRFREIDGKYPHDRDLYRQRLEMELGVIKKMGFPGYFLIVQDFINWAKEHHIPVGPGRGSGAGSIVAWSLRITDLDPLRWNLLFERFLNPERVSMPDFDVDFCQNRRDEVIQYVRGKYGQDNVGQIITFGSLKARSVIRDVVRVMGLPFAEGDRIAKLVPDPVQGKTPPLKELVFGSDKMPAEPRLKELYDKPTVISQWVDDKGVQNKVTTKDLLDIAMSLEGLNRQAGLHAAGVVIADKPLWEYVPAYKDDKSEMLVSQFAKEEVEAAGLVKFDFLGLKTLTVIDDALRMVKRNHPEMKDFAASDIPIDDPAVYELISRGDTGGVFQMESSGFTEMVVKMKPSRFEDVIAAGALYRPGPLDQKLEDGRTMVDVYIDRKHGREKVQYPHPSLEKVLEPTYGVIVYQEQVMQISQVLAGYSLGQADLLRRAMGKKKAEVMAKERVGFLAGAVANGVDDKVAGGIFDLMEKFAAYGFNKSHSAAYGLLTVQTAWLKAHYPVEFMAALISSEASNTDKVVLHISEARASQLEVLPPDVNESDAAFGAFPPGAESPKGSRGRIRFGLGAVRGVGDSAVQAIVEARASGPFKSLFDLAGRVDSKKINKKVLEALVKSGALDFEGVPRWQLYFGIDAAIAAGASAQADRASGQASLFGALTPSAATEAKPRYPRPGDAVGEVNVEEWPERVRLAFEKEALGFYLTGHPLMGYEREVRRYASSTCAAVAHKRHGDKVTVVGVVASLRERMNKEKGTRFGFLTLEDLTGTTEVICWASRPAQNGRPAQKGWSDWEHFVKGDEPVLVHGEVRINNREEENPRAEITALDIEPLAAVRNQKTSEIALRIDADRLTAARAGDLRALLGRFSGSCPVTVRAVIPEQTETTIAVPLKVQPADELLESARRLGFEVELR